MSVSFLGAMVGDEMGMRAARWEISGPTSDEATRARLALLVMVWGQRRYFQVEIFNHPNVGPDVEQFSSVRAKLLSWLHHLKYHSSEWYLRWEQMMSSGPT